MSRTRNIIVVLALFAVVTLKYGESLKCGTSASKSNQRIVGGEKAKPNQFPWMAYLEIQYVGTSEGLVELYFNCDGTLIDGQWVLTAAHCFVPQDGYKLNRVSVVLGAHNLANHSEQRTVIFAKRIFRHTRFSTDVTNSKYDIAMVMLSHSVDLTSHIAPICLPSDGEVVSKSECQNLGWGTTGTYDKTSNVLKVVNLSLLSTLECAKTHTEVSDLQVCAGYEHHGPCKGDGGGPLQCRTEDGSWVIQGITSYGGKICGTSSPGVFTNVEKFISWINEIKQLQLR